MFAEKPAMQNACGQFCETCKAEMHAKASESMKQRIEALNGVCVWCGEMITDTSPAGKSNEHCNIHASCESKRDWVLKCVRYSDRMAKYVTRIEDREKPIRDIREQQVSVASKIQNKTEQDIEWLRQRRDALANTPGDDAAKERLHITHLLKLTQPAHAAEKILSIEAKIDKLLKALGE
jgi:hypothetical protein